MNPLNHFNLHSRPDTTFSNTWSGFKPKWAFCVWTSTVKRLTSKVWLHSITSRQRWTASSIRFMLQPYLYFFSCGRMNKKHFINMNKHCFKMKVELRVTTKKLYFSMTTLSRESTGRSHFSWGTRTEIWYSLLFLLEIVDRESTLLPHWSTLLHNELRFRILQYRSRKVL